MKWQVNTMSADKLEREPYQYTRIEGQPEPTFKWEDRAVKLEIVDVIAGVDVRSAFGDRITGENL